VSSDELPRLSDQLAFDQPVGGRTCNAESLRVLYIKGGEIKVQAWPISARLQ